ncbi:methylated-DNA--[protein]-cysteine S-methyltransferase [Aridibaculum aurantiacum]|uniref:methylated-DNA--[protein]-cysteine S-methyltransferase n=1 Tax=Aridibaculum aurantiacum TaxID=2810307 RepID=UPI001A95B922|nr:methylated-DNA--[protein]-cysteine S-methyltransferase [Aridibaculum aurantiacum]
MEATYLTYYQSPIGLLRIAATEHFVQEVTFVDNEDDLQPPNDHPILHTCLEEIIEYFNGHRRSFTIPVHQLGTEFQIKVWAHLMNINFGKTISYTELARRMGDVKTIRAAASSNGKNKVCIIIPCHRVIGSNQSLVGYVGGLWRKKWLLDHENKIANGVQTLF